MSTRCCPRPKTAHLAMLVAALAGVASCGKVRLDPVGDAPDATVSGDASYSPDAGATPADAQPARDAGSPGGPCVWTPFDQPRLLFGIADDDDWLGSLSEDGQSLVIDRYLATLNDLFITHRDSLNDPFGTAVAMDELNTPAREATGILLAGGLEIYFSSDRDPTPSSGLWWASRRTPDGVFDPPVQIAELNADGNLEEHVLTPDGLTVYFTSTRAGSAFGSRNIWFAKRESNDQPFSPPRPLDELNSDSVERAPGISADGLEIFFSTERAGNGDLDLWRATRSSVDEPFGPPEPVDELSTINDEVYARLSPDGSSLYLNYDTETDGNLNANVWEARRQCLSVAP